MDFSNNTAGVPPLAFTHGGRFHADDVFSAAMLSLLRPDIRFYRGYEIPKGFSGIVFDIGGGEYDHHTQPLLRRENGTAYAAFGLLWRQYGRHFLSEAEALRFDEKFVQPLDLDDNLGTGNFLANLIGAFNPVWDSKQDSDEAFMDAVGVAAKILEKKLQSIDAVERGVALVQKYLSCMKDDIVDLPQYVPWKALLAPSSAEFVIFPSLRGGYSVQCVPKEATGKSSNKVPFPSTWRGQPAEHLAEISGIEDLKFCHASGFMVTTTTHQSAYAACALAREDWQKRMAQSAADKENQKPPVAQA